MAKENMMAEEKKESKFMIDGKEYAVPQIETLNMDEAMIVHKYSNLTIDQIDEETGLHPGLVAAFMHIAYQRGNKDVKMAAVEKIIKNSNMVEAVKQFAADDEEEDSPEAQNSEQETPSSNGSSDSSDVSSTETSSLHSELDPALSGQRTTGPLASDTPPTSDPTTSES